MTKEDVRPLDDRALPDRRIHEGRDMLGDALTGSTLNEEIVRTCPLRRYSMVALQNRAAFYQREAIGERNPSRRAEAKREVQRTRTELAFRRVTYPALAQEQNAESLK